MNIEVGARESRIVAEVAAAICVTIAIGALLEWAAVVALSPRQLASYALLPLATSLVTFCGYAMFRLTKLEISLAWTAIATIVGLVVVAAGSSIVMLFIGCRFGACIDL